MRIDYIVFLLLFSVCARAQKAILTFTMDKDGEILLYTPIDGQYNRHVPTVRLTVKGGTPVTYETDLTSYTFVYCQFLPYQRSCDIILFPNDSVQLSMVEDGIRFQGSNSDGNQLFYDQFQKEPLLSERLKMQHVFLEYVAQKRELQSVLPAIEDSLHLSSVIEQVEKLPVHGNTTSAFVEVLKNNLYMQFNAGIVDLMQYLLGSMGKYQHIAEDSTYINDIVESIYKKLPVCSELQRYSSLLYVFKYYSYYYDKKACPEGYEPETFGPYKKYLYAPKEMLPGLLGSACMVQLKYNSEEMDLQKLQAYFNKEFPDSEYTRIINQKLAGMGSSTVNAHFVSQKIDSLSQLSKVASLSGKYLYVDLWASWCMPCRKEFSNKDRVEKILDKYKNIVTVYITWDTPDKEEAWKKCIDYYKLSGYHLMATEPLRQHIGQLIYKGNGVEIPRYILISPQGSVLHNDLSRPSEYLQLESVLDEWMK